MSNVLGHVALDTLFRAQQRQPSRMDEERRAYLEQERLLQRQQARKPTPLDRGRIVPLPDINGRN